MTEPIKTVNQHIRVNVAGVLNGLPPFAAKFVWDPHYKPDTDSPDDAYDAIQWCVVDAEDSIVARVDGGEEMAEFYAAKLNELAIKTDDSVPYRGVKE